MTTVLAIDPGNEESAWCVYVDGKPTRFAKHPNANVVDWLRLRGDTWRHCICTERPDVLAIEMIASYGMPVGREVFETCVWIGRFIQARGGDYEFVYRRDVKLHLCGSARAKDGNVRQALIDRYGGKEKAIGTKRSPGPLYGISADVWSALAIAVTWSETKSKEAA